MKTDVKVIMELPDLYKKLKNIQVSAIMKELKKSDSTLLKCFICHELIKSGNRLFKQTLPGGREPHIGLKCWKKERIGMKELRFFLGSWEGQPYHYGIIVSTSGFTRQALKFAEHSTKSLLLIDLREFITDLLSGNSQGI